MLVPVRRDCGHHPRGDPTLVARDVAVEDHLSSGLREAVQLRVLVAHVALQVELFELGEPVSKQCVEVHVAKIGFLCKTRPSCLLYLQKQSRQMISLPRL